MAKFDTEFSEARGEGAVPLRPVESVSHIDERPVIMQGILGATNLFLEYNKTKKEEAKAQKEQDIVSAFVRENTSINDAVSSGQINRSHAAIRQRAIFSKYAAAYPTFVKQFGQLNKDLLEGTELGEIKEEEQAGQDRERKLVQSMVDRGYPIDANTPPQVLEMFKTSFMATTAANVKFKELTDRAAEERAKGTYEISQFKHTASIEAANSLSAVASTHLDSTAAMVSSLPLMKSKEEAQIKLKSHFSFIEQNIADAAKYAPETAANWRKPFDELKALGNDLILGNISTDAYENELKQLKARIQIMALKPDPKLQGLYALNVLAPNSLIASLKAEELDTFVRFTSVGGVDNIPQIIGQDAKTESAIVGGMQKGIDDFLSGKYKGKEEIAKSQINAGLKTMIKQSTDAVKLGASFEKLAPAMDFFASAQFAHATKNGMVAKEDLAGIAEIQRRFYGESVAKVVSEVLDKPFNDSRRYGDLVQIDFTGGQVSVVSYDPSRAVELAPVIQEMNKAAKAMTTVVKSGAHLEGHTDYAKYWDANKGSMLPGYYTQDGQPIRQASSFTKGKIKGASTQPTPAPAPKATPPSNWWESE